VSIGGHALLALGGLAAALASCVPGRDTLERAGYAAAVAGAGAVVAIAVLGLRAGHGAEVGPLFAADALVCTLMATMPALVPAMLLAQFARAGAPHRPAWTLGLGAVAAVAFTTLPGQLGCAIGDVLHEAVAHTLAPATGGVFVLLCLLLLPGRASR
jgi:hypothetical protein